jgi:hypothetical protein
MEKKIIAFNFTLKILKSCIYDVRGNPLPIGISYFMYNKDLHITDGEKESCLIYLDNGEDFLEDFEQHTVNKNQLYFNSI